MDELPASDAVVTTRGLSRRFGRLVAVDGLSLTVRRGELFGFLGPNGAGKTTTIRMLLGLIEPSAGTIELFGRPLARARLELLAQVGALVEEPAFYPWLSGRANLEVFGLLCGGVGRARIDELLELVGLRERAGDPVRVYSQGMRQRLGIAQALLARPRLVFLDEPTNGLDPPGIEHVRGLLQRLVREQGLTVFLSSHLLHEVELLCDRVAILDRGRLLVQGEVAQLLGGEAVRLELEVDAPERARELLAAAGHPVLPAAGRPGRLVVRCPRTEVAALNRALVGAGLEVRALIPRQPTLEEFFREQLGVGPGAPALRCGAPEGDRA
ncbi:MAG: ABC transporter ATP-binding protein [Planctomycetota bacterium]|nr:MAG: ABC transporter ATP-binding protein [Planctomycetota bacterium]